ncbi:MAG: hypothetical protein M1284_03710 [Candidatus Parvarchaeota archaeon]|jgi:hypothetical protein|nr:hypothetical protein [Candidatus Parvarchaeota archaeon]MCL5420825.1 hypothetical protein [Candidatus Parvarchaeota archaeon]
MSRIEEILSGKSLRPAAFTIPLYASAQQQINNLYLQSEEMFLGLAVAVSIAAGYAVYKYYKSIKKGY